MVRYVIGVDAGGTKTETAAYDLNGEILGSAVTGYGNLLNGKEKALSNIILGIQNLVDKLGSKDLEGIYLGIAGSEGGDIVDIVSKAISIKFNISPVIMNDSKLALKALLKGEDGILTIAGTGSISFGIKDDIEKRCGGWGNLLGDEGSGYKIAIEAVKNLIHEYDYGLERSELSKDILKKLEIEDVNEIITFIYSNTKDNIAALAPIVSIRANEGDDIAIKILKEEGKALGRTTGRVFESLQFSQCRVGIVGGALKKSKILREAFQKELMSLGNIKEFIDDEVSPTKGAYYIHIKNQNL